MKALYCVRTGVVIDSSGRSLREREQQHVEDNDWSYIDVPEDKIDGVSRREYIIEDSNLSLLPVDKRPEYIPTPPTEIETLDMQIAMLQDERQKLVDGGV